MALAQDNRTSARDKAAFGRIAELCEDLEHGADVLVRQIAELLNGNGGQTSAPGTTIPKRTTTATADEVTRGQL